MVRSMTTNAFGAEKQRDRTSTDWQVRFRSVGLVLLAAVAYAIAFAAPATAGCDDDERPPTPFSLRANPIGSSGITLQWSSNVGHYDIYIRDKQGRPVPEAPDIVGGATNENYHDFFGLQPDKEYFFSIRARTKGGTQGCVSKNASETVSARTDTADMNQACSYYAQTAMENIQEMRKKQCPIPGDRFSGIWAESERTQFLYCLEQRRARLTGDANAQWLRNQDLWACEGRANKCLVYERDAVDTARKTKILGCGFSGPRWTSDGHAHYSWCMGLSADSPLPGEETRGRSHSLDDCIAKKAQAAQGSAAQGGGACAVPTDWADMLAAHNQLRGQYCGAPLAWNCDLAAEAQKFAEDCKCGHSNEPGVGENLAAKGVVPDKFPAGTDVEAFNDTWACEKDLYDFTKPVIVGGFKNNCLPPPAGEGVNGHFTQIVWRSNSQLGCGRARCLVKDKDCNVVKDKDGKESYETHWVCRYRGFDASGKSIGGNDSSQLAQNVQKPPCSNAFHSLTVPACSGGMVLTESGTCACPAGQVWKGQSCAHAGAGSTPAATAIDGVQGAPGTGGANAISAGADKASPPGKCYRGMAFIRGLCRCPSGTRFFASRCVTESPSAGSGGSYPSRPIAEPPRCPSYRPIGEYPDCCPVGTEFRNGTCRPQRGSGGATPSKSGGDNPRPRPEPQQCPRSRPVGSFPDCCPVGTEFRNGECRGPRNEPGQGSGGATPSKQGGNVKTCPNGKTVFKYMQCPDEKPKVRSCPPGYRVLDRPNKYGAYCEIIPRETPPPKKTVPPPPKQLPPPPKPTPPPRPHCTGGKVNRSPDGACVCPGGTTERNGQCVDAVR